MVQMRHPTLYKVLNSTSHARKFLAAFCLAVCTKILGGAIGAALIGPPDCREKMLASSNLFLDQGV